MLKEKCPKCGKELTACSSNEFDNNTFRCVTRTVYGHCLDCNRSCEIEQHRDLNTSKWLTIRYRFYKLVGLAWHNVNELPVPPVHVGPEPIQV